MSLLKILMAMGSQKEEVFVHGQDQVRIGDLKREICRVFKIPPDEQVYTNILLNCLKL